MWPTVSLHKRSIINVLSSAPPLSHAVYLGVPRPLSESLSEEPENDARQTPESNQAHVRHDGGNISALDRPGGDEFGESVAPDILVDGDGHEN